MQNKFIIDSLAFQNRIVHNYSSFTEQWLTLQPTEIIHHAEEIAVTHRVYSELRQFILSMEELDYLLKFENPLEVVRDCFLESQKPEQIQQHISDQLERAVVRLSNKQIFNPSYALSKVHQPTPKEPLSVREFLEGHPGETVDMMTPGGYIYLTPQKTERLLAGESVMGNPGCPGFDMEMTADELLNQVVANADFQKGVWNLLSAVAPEQTQAGMEVTMC